MFCVNCGKNIPDGSAFCRECGASQQVATIPVEQPAPQPIAQQPAPQPITHPAPAPAPKASAPAPAKLITLIITAVCILSLILSYVYVVNASVEKLPFVKLIMGSDADDFKEMKYEIGEEVDRYEENFEDIEDDLSTKEKKVVENAIDAMKGLSKNFSINGMKKLVSAAEDIEEIEEEYGLYSSGVADGADEVLSVLNAFVIVIVIFMLICMVFCALGGLLRKPGLTIAGLVCCTIYSLVFCGILFFLLFAALNVANIIFCKKVNAEAAAA